MRRLLTVLALASCLRFLWQLAAGCESVKISSRWNWKLQGIHAWYYWARRRDILPPKNLDVTIDQGEGSAATVTRVMSGAYDAGCRRHQRDHPDAATKPAETPVMVYMIYSKAPFALLTKRTVRSRA